MWIPDSTVGLIFAFISLICWGSWSNAFVKAQKAHGFRFELFYIDFSISMPIVQLIICATLGQTKFNDWEDGSLDPDTQVLTDELPGHGVNILWALGSGAIFNLSNILLVNAIDMAGMSIAFPLGVGTALVEGTVITYCIDPTGKPGFLFTGVALGFIAVCLISVTYRLKQKEEEARTYEAIQGHAQAGDQLLDKDTPAGQQHGTGKVVAVALMSGLLMGAWNPLIVKAMEHNGSDRWSEAPMDDPTTGEATKGHGLSPYAAMMWFQVAVLVSTFIYSVPLMARPLTGADPVPWYDYFYAGSKQVDDDGHYEERSREGCRAGNMCCHLYGWLGGLLWAVGTACNIISGSSVGFAISYAIGQSAPVVATLWGLLYWREFDNTSCTVKLVLCGVFAFYAGAVTCVALSR